MKGKKAFLRAYGPVIGVYNTPEDIPAGVPWSRVWTEVYGGADAHALCAGVWRVDALRYLVMLRPWETLTAPRLAGRVLGDCFCSLGPEIPVWAYAGIAADGPVRINGFGDLPGAQS
jgi:hypothetical protein